MASVVLSAQASHVEAYRAAVNKIIAEAISDASATAAWNRLAELTDQFPARLSGSVNLEHAIAWATDQMMRDGFDTVRIDKVMVPHWVRGRESGEIVSPYPQPLALTALGDSVGTGPDGIQAETLVVTSFNDLEARASTVKGKIVVYDVPFQTDIDPLAAYQQGTQYRRAGASRAAARGAVAVLVRSVGPMGYRTPHTGALAYAAGQPRIPAAAISVEDAEKLQRMQNRGDRVVVRISIEAQMLPDGESGNVVAELRGREKPDEFVVIGGHLDSWDLAAGAMDDGGGCVAAWEALRLLRRLDLVPRRTIRLVLFTNEENGTRGGTGYRNTYAASLDKHVLMLESDNGVLPLQGWGFSGSDAAKVVVKEIAGLMEPIGGTHVSDDFNGTDIQPSAVRGVPAVSPRVDLARYFFLHHTPADTVDHIVPSELSRIVAGIASMAYVVADLPDPLPRK